MLVLLGWLLLAPVALEAAIAAELPTVEERSSWSAEQWIAAVDARTTWDGIRYSVQRTTERAGTTVEERWRIVQYGTSFRIDYFGDTARQITFDGTHLVDYVPANRRAMRFDTTRMAVTDTAAMLGNVLEKVAVPNFRVGRPTGVEWRFAEDQSWDGRPAVVIDGTGQGASLRYVLDSDRLSVLHTEIVQNGQVILNADSRDHREVLPGVWLPHEIELRAPDKGGEVRVRMHLTKVSVLTDSPAELFEPRLDPSIPVEERP